MSTLWQTRPTLSVSGTSWTPRASPWARPLSGLPTCCAARPRPTFTPNADCGDYVIIINAGKAVLTGKKGTQKMYRTHSGWIGGLKETPYRILMQEQPELAMKVAVRGMLPKNTIGKESLKRLHIYADANYEQQAQKPVALDAE